MGTYSAWLYREPTALHMRGAPSGTPPIMSQRGVRQGDTLSMLHFGLALQDPLELTQAAHPDAALVAIADDCALQRPEAAVVPAFRALVGHCQAIGLDVKLPKSGAYSSQNKPAAARVAAALGIPHREDGIVAAGSPMGTDAFVAAQALKTSVAACAAIDTLLGLESLPAQDKTIIMRSSLQMRTAHLPRVVPWAQAQPAVQQLERKTAEAMAEIMQRPVLTGIAAAQLTLPLSLGGLGIRETSAEEATAGHLSAAAMTEAAMTDGPQQFKPFSGPSGARLRQDWAALRAAAPDLWPAEAAAADAACIKEVLPGAQREFSRFQAGRRQSALLASCNAGTIEGHRQLARLLACACRQSAIWLDTLPMAPALQLSNRDFICAMRHRLGITQLPANAVAHHCWCNHPLQADDTDHAMACPALSGKMTLRHDILKEIWRRRCRAAGIATSLEPQLRLLRGRAAAIAAHEDARGDVLVVLPDGLRIVDVSIIHPASDSNATAAATTAGAAAEQRDREKIRKYRNADPTGYNFVPLSTESFGRHGRPAMVFLKKLADYAASMGSADAEHFVTNSLRELSIGLCRVNAVVYRGGLVALLRVTGRVACPGNDRPTAEVL